MLTSLVINSGGARWSSERHSLGVKYINSF